MADEMILFDVTVSTTESQRADLLALLRRTMAGSLAEPGCLIYRFTADLDDPLRFYLIELWESEAALIAHASGAALRTFMAELPGCGSFVSSTARKGAMEPYTFRPPRKPRSTPEKV